MTDRDRDVRERCAEIARSLKLKTAGPTRVDWQLGYTAACREIEELIRALDLPLTSAREVTDHLRRAFRAVDNKDWEYLFTNLLDGSGHGQFWCAVLSEARTALASAPQPACVGEDEMAGRKAKMLALHRAVCAVRSRRMPAFEHDGTALLDDLGLACLWGAQAIDALSPAPSPQAGGVTLHLEPRDDGGWRLSSPTHPGLILSGVGMHDVLTRVPSALRALSARREG